jgi:hypothetical protein
MAQPLKQGSREDAKAQRDPLRPPFPLRLCVNQGAERQTQIQPFFGALGEPEILPLVHPKHQRGPQNHLANVLKMFYHITHE